MERSPCPIAALNLFRTDKGSLILLSKRRRFQKDSYRIQPIVHIRKRQRSKKQFASNFNFTQCKWILVFPLVKVQLLHFIVVDEYRT